MMTPGWHIQPKNHTDSHWACAEIDLPLKKKNKRRRQMSTCFLVEITKCQQVRSWQLNLMSRDTSPAAESLFKASSSMTVAVRYLVSYLYLKAVSSANKRKWYVNHPAVVILCKITTSNIKSPLIMCCSSCVWVSGTFFCCSGVTVPRANTTSTSALNCSYKKIRNRWTFLFCCAKRWTVLCVEGEIHNMFGTCEQ